MTALSTGLTIMTNTKSCPICGQTFEPRNIKHVYCSLKCRRRAERNIRTVEKTCPVCGKIFSTAKSNQIYCSNDCREIKHQNLSRKYLENKGVCQWCGKGFIKTYPVQKYCSIDCSHLAYHEKSRIATNKYNCKQRELGLVKKPAPRVKREPKKTLAQWTDEARQCGLSYGNYRAAIEQLGLTFEQLLERKYDNG